MNTYPRVDESPLASTACNDSVLFTSPNYYVTEAQPCVVLDVLRLGELNSAASVRWQTQDGSAKAGVDYCADDGILEFAAGERGKRIQVKIIDDTIWGLDKVFRVVLADPSGPVTLLLDTANVHVLDDDVFPQNCPNDAPPERSCPWHRRSCVTKVLHK